MVGERTTPSELGSYYQWLRISQVRIRTYVLGFNILNKIIVFFVDSQVQKFIFGLFCQCLYSYQNKGPRGARVQNHSTVTHGYLNNLEKAILLGLG